jgi:hypothetical protein
MAKTKSNKPQSKRSTKRRTSPPKDVTNAAPKNGTNEERVDAFMTRLFNDPATKALNPGLKWVNGRFESEPDKPRAPLVDLGGKRRDKAITEATWQMAGIFNAQIALLRMERGDIAMWPKFDEASLPDIVRSLAVRGHDLNEALISARSGCLDTEQLEDLVYDGSPIHSYKGDSSIKSAKSKTGLRARKVAATA